MASFRTLALATAAIALCLSVQPAAAADDAGAPFAGRGKQALQGGDHANALQMFLRAHQAAPDNRDYVHNAAALAAALGRADEAAGLFRAAARLAAKAGARDDVTAYNQEIAKLREALPAWAAEKQQAASGVPEGKQSSVAVWDRVHNAAIKAAAAGDLAKALNAANQAVTIARDNLGPAHFATIVSLTDLAQVQGVANQPADAEASYAQALETAVKVLGDGHPETLKIRQSLADHHAALADNAKARTIRAEQARIAAARLGESHGLTLAARTALARELASGGRYGEAEAVLAPTCAARLKAYGDTHPESARCLAQHAELGRLSGDLAAAGTRMDQALAIAGTALADSDAASFPIRIQAGALRLAQGRAAEAQGLLEAVVRDAQGDITLLNAAKGELIDVLDARGDYAAAETMARDVLTWQTGTYGSGHPVTVATLTSLASIYRKQGRLADAEQTFKEAFEQFGKVLGKDHRSTIVAANNLGEILEKQGLYDQAEPYLRAAADGSRKAFGEANPTTLISLNNLALLYESQGDFDKAEALYGSVAEAFGKSVGASHPDTLAFVNNLAYLHLLKQDFAKAEPLFRRVVAGWSAAHGATHQNTLKARNSLARVLHRTGRLVEAETEFNATLAARRKALGDKHLDVLRSQHDLAVLYRTQKRLPEARQLLERTLGVAEKVLGPLHPYTFETLNSLAATKEDIGDLKGAVETRKLTFDRRNEFLNRMLYVTGDNAREGYVRLHQPELAAYADLLTRIDPAAGGRGLMEISLNRKGLLFKVASELAQIARLSRDPAMAGISEQLTELRKRLAALTLSGPTEETKDRHLDVLAELEDQINRLQGELGRASARFRKTVRPISADDLVANLPDDAVLVDFVLFTANGKQRLMAATLRKDGGKPQFGLLPYGDPAVIDATVQNYRKDIQDEELDLDDILDSGAKTHDLVWKPLEPVLAGKAKVFVVPDGMLNILPFAALVDKAGKYLIERVDLHIYTSARNLLPSPLAPAKGGYIINAGPDYNSDEVTGKETLERARSRSAGTVQNTLRGMSSGMRGLKFDPLPGAEKEGQLIRQSVAANGATNAIFTKRDAQEKVLRELSEPPEILHIATHGFFLKADDTLRKRLLKLQRGSDIQLPPPGDNPLLRSGLAFAGINANAQLLGEIDTDNDGVLTALEVLSLNLTGTKLAILSACETGLGEIHEGEGVYGLRRAFQEAGASTVVSSLWEVSDAGTQKLMTALYSRLLARQSPHQSLREAQLEMLRIGEWSSPYIWSAFFMVDG
jgi:CHAT domain-containing protein/tetratricopeptide (TPR) repeat protein